MREFKKPYVHLEAVHKDPKSGLIHALRFAIHYGHAQAHIDILPAKNLSDHIGLSELARIELSDLCDALEVAVESSSNITLHPPPKTEPGTS